MTNRTLSDSESSTDEQGEEGRQIQLVKRWQRLCCVIGGGVAVGCRLRAV